MGRLRIRTAVAIALVAMLLAAVAGCGGGSPSPAPTTGSPSGEPNPVQGTVISMEDYAFVPSAPTVKVGDTVTFENKDAAPHRVSIDGQDLGQQDQGQKVEWKATKAGTFPFSCTIHPAMTGQITVQ